MRVHLTKTFWVEAAHRNPAGGAAQARLHGHSYRIDIHAAGEVASPYGWLIDYGEIKARFRPLYEQLDHRCLNDVAGLEDTTLPGLRAWLLEQFAPRLDTLTDIRVAIVGDCEYRPAALDADPAQGLPARLRFTFEAAQYLGQLPEGHPCRNLHGHSYRIEAAAADLDGLRAPLRGLYDALDHRCLNDIAGLENATCEIIARWMWERLAPEAAGLELLIVQETDSARCIYHGE